MTLIHKFINSKKANMFGTIVLVLQYQESLYMNI